MILLASDTLIEKNVEYADSLVTDSCNISKSADKKITRCIKQVSKPHIQNSWLVFTKRAIAAVSIICTLLFAGTLSVEAVRNELWSAVAESKQHEHKPIAASDFFIFKLENHPQFGNIKELVNFIQENMNTEKIETVDKTAIRVWFADNDSLDFDNNYCIFMLEHYPQFETIDELKDYICDKMSIKTAEIFNDTAIRVQLLTGESKYPTHSIGELLGPALIFSRRINNELVLDYYHVYNFYNCKMHEHCSIIQDTCERVVSVCAETE